MPGKKRKADTKMWGSPSSSSASSRRKAGGSSSRRGGGASAYSTSGINEAKAEKLFEEICDEDNPGAASMEGKLDDWMRASLMRGTDYLFHCQCLSRKTSCRPVVPPYLKMTPSHPNAINENTTGICKLCEQLDLDPLEDVRVLVLLWKLGANKKPAEIQKEEWIAGCHKLQLDSIDKFKSLVPALDTGFLDREEFSDFYKVCLMQFVIQSLVDVGVFTDFIFVCSVLLPIQPTGNAQNPRKGPGSSPAENVPHGWTHHCPSPRHLL